MKRFRKEKNSFGQAIKNIKSLYDLEAVKTIPISLDNYSILNKGNSFRHTYSWRFKDFEKDVFLLSIKNSYTDQTTGTSTESLVNIDVENKFLAVLICNNRNLPDLCIRPAYLTEKVANFFLRFDVKLKNQKSFNAQYILETNGDSEILNILLNEKFISLILDKKGFHLEINIDSILLKFEKGVDITDTKNLIEISEVIIKNLKNIK